MEKEKLSFNEYQLHAYNLISEEGKKDMITNGVLGLAGEAGECCDIVKKYKLGFNSEYNKYLFKRITGTILFEKNKVKGLKAYIKGIRDSKKLICTK